MTAAPPVIPAAPEPSLNGSVSGQFCMDLSRFAALATNSASQAPSSIQDPIFNDLHYRHYPSSSVQDLGPPAPTPPMDHHHHHHHHHHLSPCQLDNIESRLRQLEQEDAARMLTRTQLLAIRKREDDEFRRVTENAEMEEEVYIYVYSVCFVLLLLLLLLDCATLLVALVADFSVSCRNCAGNESA